MNVEQIAKRIEQVVDETARKLQATYGGGIAFHMEQVAEEIASQYEWRVERTFGGDAFFFIVGPLCRDESREPPDRNGRYA